MLLLLLACATEPSKTDDDTAVGHDTSDTDDTDTGVDSETGDTDSGDTGETGDTDTGDTGDTGETGDTNTETGDTDPGDTGPSDEFFGGTFDVEADASTTWTGTTNQWFGWELSPTGDVDGDGVVDLLVASSYGGSSSGGGGGGREPALTMIYGFSFGPGDYAASVPPQKWLDYPRYDYSLAGDFDGDGFNEIAWIGNDMAGRNGVGFVWGDGTRWTDGGNITADTLLQASLPLYVSRYMDIDDADGDGISDMLAATGAGATVVYGGTRRLTNGDLGAHPAIEGPGGWFGGGDVALGDLDGDGLGDFAIADVYANFTDADQPGAVYIVYSSGRLGADLSLPGDADAVFRGPTGMGLVYMGYTMATGDLDGDGFTELIAGAHSYDSAHGIVWVFEGKSRWSGEYTTGDAKGYVYGSTVMALGAAVEVTDDVDGDGGKELFVGASSTGAYLFVGSVNGSLTEADADLSLTGGPADSRLGLSLASGDLDDDGIVDLVTSGYNAAYGAGNGAVWFFSGTGF